MRLGFGFLGWILGPPSLLLRPFLMDGAEDAHAHIRTHASDDGERENVIYYTNSFFFRGGKSKCGRLSSKKDSLDQGVRKY